MKLLAAKKRKIAIIFSGGLGDTLLYLPLLKELKKKQFHITAIFYGRYENDCLFDYSLTDARVHIKSKASLLAYGIKHAGSFVNFYINYLAKGKLIALVAKICSTRITQTENVGKGNKRMKRIILVERSLTYAEQNLNLLYTVANARITNISCFFLDHPVLDPAGIKSFVNEMLPDYFVIQVSSGNNKTPFKNWPLSYWIDLIRKLCENCKDISFLLVGDNTETEYANVFAGLSLTNCKIIIGKTTIPQLFNLLAGSIGYIGLDSGIMHMAAALQKKTLSIFGASNEKLLSYAGLDGDNHAVIIAQLSCRPCSSWKNANTSRVTDPLKCPDFACLKNISAEEVYHRIAEHFRLGS